MARRGDSARRLRSVDALAAESGIPARTLCDHDWLVRAIAYVLGALDTGPSLDEVAGIAGYEATYFSKKFRAAVGRPYSRWLTEVRACRAADLLCDRDCSVLDAALAVGYSGTRSLERICRTCFGRTPTQLRESRKPPRSAERDRD